MQDEVIKLKSQVHDLLIRLEKNEQRLMSIEREIAEQALISKESEPFNEPLMQRAPHKQTFYKLRNQKKYGIIKVAAMTLVAALLLCYAGFIVT